MMCGELYRASDQLLVEARHRARRLCRLFNRTSEQHLSKRFDILSKLFGAVGFRTEIEPPFHCDYGCNIFAGVGLYMNFGCVLLDCRPITIGDNVLLGPGVHIYAASHPVDPAIRETGRELALPVSIGSNVWIGGGAIICPGISIGDGSVIGAGSVVTRSVPPTVLAAGNPCRVIRTLDRHPA